MTKKYNKGSKNQNAPMMGNAIAGTPSKFEVGDNSKGNKRNKDQQDKTD